MSRLEEECNWEFYLRSIGKSCWDEQTFNMKTRACNWEPRELSEQEKQSAIDWYQEQGLE